MAGNSFTRAKPRRKKHWAVVIVAAIALAALLTVGGIIGIRRYKIKQTYRQYPLAYKETIVQMAKDFNLEPWHIAAVVRCESSFNAKATSGVGARGLMQIMPDTGEWLAGKFDEDDQFDPEWLYEPEYNLKYGCWYLSWLMDRYDGDITLATAAYHAGQTCVDGLLSDPSVSPDGKTIDVDSIPYPNTKTYVNRVLTACTKYKELYDYEN